MSKNTIYIGYYKGKTEVEAVGLWHQGAWDVFLAENDVPNRDQHLFKATSLDEAYDHFYDWVDAHLPKAQ
ncbi:hypothetical protein N781_04925 [Pontibacillus halophilus JSM 076056 = DSM 19796]|uniref:Uncharacterized protein n=1 Tax=Pontibacillus halophilus JSM 076056 = DSM 19796 TaxID=1385510 RepID=A0A0A5GD65_9BACI|nr:hypothetical protein [Pontibacillus halophilus]KGX91156.1 hypothetical protein N781_04925 [Pontibacillus halophilus JSM 076056 = DSM 19796]